MFIESIYVIAVLCGVAKCKLSAVLSIVKNLISLLKRSNDNRCSFAQLL